MSTPIDRPRMLVPFDGSAAAERVLRAACQGAKADQAPLVVLCVVPIPAGRAADEVPLDASAGVMAALIRAMDICRDEGVTATFEETYATNLADEILRVADSMQACVIALPLDGQTPGETALMSVTVQRVLAGAHCTVMLGARG
jgi:nucleotide-binding universal stress UspA family protein